LISGWLDRDVLQEWSFLEDIGDIDLGQNALALPKAMRADIQPLLAERRVAFSGVQVNTPWKQPYPPQPGAHPFI
jgi:hypothetical protein